MPALPDIEIAAIAAPAVEPREIAVLAEYWDEELTLPGNLNVIAWWLTHCDANPPG